jgi:hypothetical protein
MQTGQDIDTISLSNEMLARCEENMYTNRVSKRSTLFPRILLLLASEETLSENTDDDADDDVRNRPQNLSKNLRERASRAELFQLSHLLVGQWRVSGTKSYT